ncbi:MAG: Cold shock protein of CSP family, partial [uncultured Nocardioides sp.]
GFRHRQVVQRREGLRLHRTGWRRRGRLRPLLRDPVQRLQVARREPEGRVRPRPGPQGPAGGERHRLL